MTNKKSRADDFSINRRNALKSGTVMGLLGMTGTAAAAGSRDEHQDDGDDDSDVDEPEGFNVEILAGHAPFPDELAATFSLTFTDEDDGKDDYGSASIGAHAHLDDESTMIVAEVSWEPGGMSGWHRHPGVVLVSTLEGELEVTWAQDCVPRTYSAGDGWFDPGEVHKADNVSDDEPARAYAVFLGIPDGEPATIWVEPPDC